MKTHIRMAMLLITSLFLLYIPINGRAQERQLRLDLNYSIGIPGGSFKTDAVDKTSFRGWTANLLYNVTDKFRWDWGRVSRISTKNTRVPCIS